MNETIQQFPVPVRSHVVRTNGVRLHVVEAGPEDGTPVILLHGFPEFWYGWRHQIPALVDAGCRVIVPDQRGYNRSDTPAPVAAYDVDELVGDVLGLVDEMKVRDGHLVGHDWGGVVAWVLAMRHPDRLRRLAILNVPHPGVFRETLWSSWEQLQRSGYVFLFQLPRLPEWWLGRNDSANLVRMLRGSGRRDTFTAQDLAAYRQSWRRPRTIRSMVHWYRAAGRRALQGGLPDQRVHVPTRVIWGAKDVALIRQMARPSADRCDDADLFMIDAATHWVQHDAPDRVNDLLIGHLQKTES
jgi:pimeloyl-ACP methyl ester carboxylesterase